MARGSSWGFGSNQAQARCPGSCRWRGHFPAPSVQRFVSFRRSLVLILAVLCLAGWMSVRGYAQSDQQDDVHIKPRQQMKDPNAEAVKAAETPPTDMGVDVDPSLKTHTKPIMKDVDLVLVPWDPLESTCRHASLSIL